MLETRNTYSTTDPNKKYFIECLNIKKNKTPILLWSIETDGIVQTKIKGDIDTKVNDNLHTIKTYTIINATSIRIVYNYNKEKITLDEIKVPFPIEIE